MKIFSSFDTNFKKEIIEREIQKYGKENFMVVSHGKFYYVFYVILPGIFLIVGTIIYISLMIYFAGFVGEFVTAYYVIALIVLLILLIPAVIRFLKKYIDYILDFVVVNPYSMIYYNQEGIFSRNGRSVEVDKIKTITIQKDGIIRSLFNFGNIIVLTEGDEKGTGDISFGYIDDPDNVKSHIFDIINIKDENFLKISNTRNEPEIMEKE